MILVSGATGHIGNVLVRKLLERGESVRALVLPGEDCSPIQGRNLERVMGDVLDLESLTAAYQDIQLVYHLAGVIGPYDYRRSEMGHLILNSLQGKIQIGIEGAYDFVDVRDVAEGLILAGEKGRCGENYILSGERLSLRQLIAITQEVSGRKSYLLQLPVQLAHLLAYLAPLYYRLSRSKPLFTPYALATVTSNSNISSAKAQQELGYRPRSLRQTIADSVEWFRMKNHETLETSL